MVMRRLLCFCGPGGRCEQVTSVVESLMMVAFLWRLEVAFSKDYAFCFVDTMLPQSRDQSHICCNRTQNKGAH